MMAYKHLREAHDIPLIPKGISALTKKCHKCLKSPLKFFTMSQLKEHLDEKHNGFRHRCQFCKKGFFSCARRADHELFYHQGMGSECPKCKKIFANENNMTFHLNKVCGKYVKHKPCSCEKCGKSLSGKAYLKLHLETHEEKVAKKKETCTICMKDFVNIRLHNKHVHGERIHACHLCQSRFSIKSKLTHHIQQSHNSEVLKCTFEDCGASYKCKQSLDMHLNEFHLGKQPSILKCPQCDGVYKRPQSLNKHIRTCHRKQRTTKCHLCGKLFLQGSQYLKQHLMVVHEGKRYHCKNCDREFTDRSGVSRHEKLCGNKPGFVPRKVRSDVGKPAWRTSLLMESAKK